MITYMSQYPHRRGRVCSVGANNLTAASFYSNYMIISTLKHYVQSVRVSPLLKVFHICICIFYILLYVFLTFYLINIFISIMPRSRFTHPSLLYLLFCEKYF